jgi:hypothetical protein
MFIHGMLRLTEYSSISVIYILYTIGLDIGRAKLSKQNTTGIVYGIIYCNYQEKAFYL